MRNDGKYLEDLLEKGFKENRKVNFNWRRLYDAHTAGGKFPAQPADFFLSHEEGGSCHVECKSQEGKTRRLKKFSQHAGMVRWAKAGVHGLVVVHFHEVDELWLTNVNSLKLGKPSWVLNKSNSMQFDSEKELIRYLMEG